MSTVSLYTLSLRAPRNVISAVRFTAIFLCAIGGLLAQGSSPQTISFPNIPNQILGGGPFPITAKASSTLAVTFQSQTTGVCTNSGAFVTVKGAGTCSIEATQPGGSGYVAATPVTKSFTVFAAAPTGTFQQASGSPFTGLSGAFFPASADFNGDGFDDIAVANSGANTMTIFLSNGAGGGFTAGSPISTAGSFPVQLAPGDFDGDGVPDLVVMNQSSANAVTIFKGNGSGGFSLLNTYAAGTTALFAAVGDFNNDGKQDLAITNYGSNNVTILTGSGTGTFVFGATVSVGTGPYMVAVADFNGDGKLDFATPNANSNDVSVLLGNGATGFTPAGSAVSTGASSKPQYVAVGDFNKDGVADLAVALFTSNKVGVLLGTGSGTFTSSGNFSTNVGTESVVVHDFDGDGNPDIAATDFGTHDIWLLRGNGTGGFTSAAGNAFTLGSTADYNFAATGDFNGDHRPDIVVTQKNGSALYVLMGVTTPTTSSLSTTSLLTVTEGTSVPLTLNVSPIGSVFRSATGSASLYDFEHEIYLGDASQSSSPYTFTTGGLSRGPHPISADYNGGSGSAASTSNFIEFTVLGNQTITFNPLSDKLYSDQPNYLIAYSDSGLPVALTSNTPSICTPQAGEVSFVKMLATGLCSITASQPGDPEQYYAAATSVTRTFNISKGNQYIQFTTASAGIMPYYGGSAYQLPAISKLPVGYPSHLPVTVTSDTPSICTTANGLVQFIAPGFCTLTANQPGNSVFNPSSPTQWSVEVHQTAPSGKLVDNGAVSLSGTGPSSLALGDFDIDSYTDIAVLNSGASNVTLLRGSNSGTFQQSGSISTGAAPSQIVSGDLDGDGYRDLVVTVPGSNTVSVYISDRSGSFYLPQNVTVANAPTAVAIGDFNSDGIPDLVVTQATTNTLQLLAGDGFGNFEAFGTPAQVGAGIISVAVADFNGDGKQDLVATASGVNKSNVFLGNGSGEFTQASGSPITMGTSPQQVIVADFNKDGKQDFAAVNAGSNNLTVMLGVGDGTFTAASGGPFTTGQTPRSLVAVDINGDGFSDLVAANYNGNSVTVLLGNGTGTFVQAVTSSFATGSGPVALLAGNFDHNDKHGIAVVNQNGNDLTVLHGTLLSTTAAISSTSPASVPYGVAIPLTLTVTPEPGGFGVPTGQADFYADESGLGTAPQNSSPYTLVTSSLSVGVHSINAAYLGDSRSSWSIADPISRTVTALPQTITFNALSDRAMNGALIPSNATASSGLTVELTSNTTATCGVSGLNIILLSIGNCSITASQPGGEGYTAADPVNRSFNISVGAQTITFNTVPDKPLGVSPFQVSVQSSSLLPVGITSTTPTVCKSASGLIMPLATGTCTLQAAQPGNANYTAATTVSRSFIVKLAKAAGHFTGPSTIAVGSPSFVVSPGDFNGDGITDFAVPNIYDSQVTFMLGNGNGTFSAARLSPYALELGGLGSIAGDFNGDGYSDLAVGDADQSVSVFLGSSTGQMTLNPAGPFPLQVQGFFFTLGDFNGDGKQDIASANIVGGTISIGLGDGRGGFSPAGSPVAAGASITGIAVADVNGDGKQDIVAADSATNKAVVLLGDGIGAFSSPAVFVVGSQPSAIAVGDLDADGKIDIVTTNEATNTVTVLLGDGAGGFTPDPHHSQDLNGENLPPGNFLVGFAPSGVVLGDFTGDGLPDIAVSYLAGASGDGLTILKNGGSGIFNPVPNGPFNLTAPFGLHTADFNNDGIADLASISFVGVEGSAGVDVLLGSLTPSTSVLSTTSSSTITFGSTAALTLTIAGTGGSFNPEAGSATLYDGATPILTATETASPYTFTTAPLSVGAHVLTGQYLSSSGNTNSTSNAITITVLNFQTIAFNPLGDVNLGSAPFTVSATASSGLDVAFASNTTSVCTVNVNTVTIVSAGTCYITASQGGGSGYGPAASVTRTFQVNNPTPQSISFFTFPNQILGVAPFPVIAKSTSGLPVSFASLTASVCATAGNLVTILTPGSCTIQASQAGNATYTAATSVSNTISIVPAFPKGTMAVFSPPSIAVGTAPAAVAVTDFNHDNLKDMVIADPPTDSVAILIGNGLGGFTVTHKNTGDAPTGVVTGDFNRDGNMDFAAVNQGSQNITVYLGDGSGGFSPAPGSPFADANSLPKAAVVGDFNGDSIPDLAVINSGANNVLIMPGNGSGGFTSGATFAIGANPSAIGIADFNRDGNQDLVIAGRDTNDVRFLFGDGGGGFTGAPGNPFAVGTGPAALVVADFNNDGKSDVATANYTGNNISILFGNGSGAFAQPIPPITATGNPNGLTAGDFDGNGAVDLAVALSTTGNVQIFINHGQSGAVSGGTFATDGGFPNGIVAADFDGDNAMDLAILNDSGGNVTLLQGAPAVTISALSTTSPLTVTAGTSVTFNVTVTHPIAEYDKPRGTLTMFDSESPIGSAPEAETPFTFTTPPLGAGTHQFTAVYAGDAHSLNSTSNTVSIQVKTAQTISFTQPPNVALSAGTASMSASASSGLSVSFASTTTGVCTTSSNSIVTLVSAGSCSITASQGGDATYAPATPVTRIFTVSAPASQTITFNPILDHFFGGSPFVIAAQASSLLPVTYTSTTPFICKTTSNLLRVIGIGTCTIQATQAGNGSYSAASPVNRSFLVKSTVASGTVIPSGNGPFGTGTGTGPSSVAQGDFNGDGLLDLVTANQTGNSVTVLLASAAGAGGFTPLTPIGVGATPLAVVTGDFNGDGKTDIATVNQGSNNVSLLFGNGSGGFSASTVPVGTQPRSLAVGDFNNDGIADIVVADTGLNLLHLLQGNGNGTFLSTTTSGGSAPNAVAVSDFNSDGKQDIAVANNQGFVTILTNSGSSFASTAQYITASGSNSLAIGDYNNDGLPDIAVGNGGSASVMILIGDGAGGFSMPSGSTISTTDTPLSITVGDYNGDSKADLAIVTSVNVLVGIGQGNGKFTLAAGGGFTSGSGPSAGVAEDFDHDGYLDLATVNQASNNVYFLKGSPEPVSAALTTTAPSTITAGTNVPLTLTVTRTFPSFNTPTGSVVFLDGSSSMGTAAQNVSPYTFSTNSLSPGTHTLTAVYPGDVRTLPATSNSISITVQASLTPQTITFGPLSNVLLSAGNVAVSATASSGLPVGFTTSDTEVCFMQTSNTVHLVGTGTCQVTAFQGGSAIYSPAPDVSQSFSVLTGTPQTISFAPIRDHVFGTSPFVISVKSSAHLPVTISSLTTDVCRTASNLVTMFQPGNCVIEATQAGGGGIPAATPVSQTFKVNQAFAGGAFVAAAGGPVAAGVNPQAVVIGDFTGDGKLDLGVANALDPGNIGILSGSGSGGFSINANYTAGTTPSHIAVGDFDADGVPDLVSPNQGSNNATILMGTGDDSFFATTANAGNSPEGVAIGDFNGDGVQDLAFANGAGNNVTVQLGAGDGTFHVDDSGPFATGAHPRAIVVADFNNDGKQDLAVANMNANNVAILLGDGQGGFSQAHNPYSVGSNPVALVVANFNGDGFQDLAVANSGGTGGISILLGGANGSFTPAIGSPIGATTYSALAVNDFNGDGIPDLIVASNSSNATARVFKGDGTGGFTAVSPVISIGQFPTAIASDDFNDDGRADIVSTNSGDGTLSVYLGSTPTTTPQTITFGQPNSVSFGQSPVNLFATASSGLTVAFSSSTTGVCTVLGSVVTLVHAGTCSITASQPGNANFAAASNVVRSFAITKGSQTITFPPLPNTTVGGHVDLSATASSGLPVSFSAISFEICSVSGSSATGLAAGTCNISAFQVGNSDYNSASNSRSFTVTSSAPPPPEQSAQTISFPPIGNVSISAAPFGISATASSGLPVSFGSNTPNVCTVSGSTVSVSAPGTCSITASQDGNAQFSPAGTVTQSFAVTIPITIVSGNLPSGVVNQPYPTTALAGSGGSGSLVWSLFAGNLPNGISLSSGGSLGGTPTAAGSFNFTLQAADNAGSTATQGFAITVSPAVSITTTSVPNGVQGVAYTQTLAATGGTGNYSWSATDLALPGGIKLSSGGSLSGTPTATGSFQFTVQVSDGVSSASQAYTMTVAAPLSITSSGTLPGGVTGKAYSFGFAASGGNGGPYAWSVSAGSLPPGTNLSSAGSLTGNPSTAGPFSFTVRVSDNVSPPATLGVSLTVFGQLSITTLSLPNGTVGAAYSPLSLAAKGGSGAFAWTASGLPTGMTFSSAGSLGGTPTVAGNATPSFTATDSASGQSLTATIPISVVAASPTLKANPTTLTAGAGVGEQVSATFGATGGTAPYKFSAPGLPAGVTLSQAGVLSGSTTLAGTYPVAVTLTDSAATPATATAQLTLQILGITTSTLSPGAATVLYTANITAQGGTPPYVFSATGLPEGMTVSGSGALSGTTNTQGTVAFSVIAADRSGFTTTRTYALVMAKPPVSAKSQTLANGTVGAPYSGTLQASGGTPPYTWSLISGALPDGLSLAPSGTISGFPNVPGTIPFGVQVTDSTGGVASGGASITISPAPVVFTTGPLPSGVVNFSYGPQIIDITGGVEPYTFAIKGGALPPGITLVNGVISGTPTSAGTFPFTLTVTDFAANKVDAPASITIRPPTSDLILLSGSVAFSLAQGAGALPPSELVGVQSTVISDIITYSFSANPAAPWFTVSGSGTAPGSLTIALTSAALSLPAGTNKSTVTVTCTSATCQGKTQTVAVSLVVSSPPPQLSVPADLLSFTSATTPPQNQSQPLDIQNIGGGVLSISSITCGAPWCAVGSFPSSLAGGASAQVTITASPAGLASGFYRTNLDVASSGGAASLPVSFFITQTATMTLAPSGAQFNMAAGGKPGNANGSFDVGVVGNSVSWAAAVLPGAPWLTLSTSTGTSTGAAPGTVSYSINSGAASLAAGAYYATIEVTSSGASNSPQDYQVILNVAPASQPAVIDPRPGGLVFVTSVGVVPDSQIATVYTTSASQIAYQASASTTDGAKWINVPPSGSTSAAAAGISTVSVNPAGLNAGIYTGSVTFAAGSSGIRSINITLIVQAAGLTSALAPRAPCLPAKVVATQTGLVNSFSAPAAWPTPLSLQLSDDCGNVISNGQVVATFSNGDAPLAFNLSNASKGLYSATWTPRNSTSKVVINAKGTKSGLTAALAQLAGSVVPNDIPTIDPNGVVHPYDPLIGGALSPGTIVAIYGSHLGSQAVQPSAIPLPTKLNGTTVLIGGVPSPLFYVSPNQINVQIPFELKPSVQYQVIVNANGALTPPQPIQLTQANPGLATAPDGSLVAVHAEDGSLITATSPAKRGEFVVLFLLGLGETDNPVTSGEGSSGTVLSHPKVPPSITINSNPVPIAFAGLAPGFVGLYQVNLKIPDEQPGGNVVIGVSQADVAGNSGILPIAY